MTAYVETGYWVDGYAEGDSASPSVATADALASYYVRGLVQSDTAGSYAVRGAVLSDASASYVVRTNAIADLSAAYDIQTASGVSSSVSASYVVRGAAQSDAAAAYDLRKSVGANSEHAVMVRGLVSSDLGSAYEVQAALMPVYADIAASYSIEGPVFGGGLSPADIAAIRAAVRSELSAELLRISEIAKLHGLVQGAPLVVTPTSRTAGDVAQTVNTAGATTTVTRQ